MFLSSQFITRVLYKESRASNFSRVYYLALFACILENARVYEVALYKYGLIFLKLNSHFIWSTLNVGSNFTLNFSLVIDAQVILYKRQKDV